MGVALECNQPCVLGVCLGGSCMIEAVLFDGQTLMAEAFDGVVPGTLPSGWHSSTSVEGWSWAADASVALTPPNAVLTLLGDELPVGGGELALHAPPFTLPASGGVLHAHIWLSALSGDCEETRFELEVNGAAMITLCESGLGFQEVSIDLSELGGQSPEVIFRFFAAETASTLVGVRVDEVRVGEYHLCDDGDPCTVGDRCVAGLCIGEPQSVCDFPE